MGPEPLPDVEEELRRRALALAEPSRPEDRATLELLVFSRGDVRLALPAAAVAEVAPHGLLTFLPGLHGSMVGLRAVRHDVVVIVDPLQLLGGGDPRGVPPEAAAVVLHDPVVPLGLLADRVDRVTAIDPQDLQRTGSSLALGITADGVVVLDPPAVCRDPGTTIQPLPPATEEPA